MTPEEALEKIEDLSRVIAASIPEELKLFGVIYTPQEDLEKREPGTLRKYTTLFEELKREIAHMSDVPDSLVEKAIILKRIIMFLKDYHQEDELEDKKRWLEYSKRVNI